MTILRKYFGTDGIRGTANKWPVTPEVAMRVGMAAGQFFKRGNYRHRVLIGKDTRLSGYIFESALQAGFASTGMDVFLLGPMPTPGVAMLTRSLRADLGVMVSASHNYYHDNGIKLFGSDGFKLNDEIELAIEKIMDSEDLFTNLPTGDNLGKVSRLEDVHGRYVEFAKNTFPRYCRLDGLKVVVDCAHGAAYRLAPLILSELGADVTLIGTEPNGTNINQGCGSTSLGLVINKVKEVQANIGIALDGDADRVILIDENGTIVDGDQLIALVAKFWKQRGALRGSVVATIMSNVGLERYLSTLGIPLVRTPVGDRYVVEKMRSSHSNIGGEQSGHIILTDFTTTGDGLIAAIQVLALMVSEDKPLGLLSGLVECVPQKLTNIAFDLHQKPLENENVQKAIISSRSKLGKDGRLIVRLSGTEPLVRIMVECNDEQLMNQVTQDITEAVKVTV